LKNETIRPFIGGAKKENDELKVKFKLNIR
jgi:hypothetical protein